MPRPITLHITSQKGLRDYNEDSHAYIMNLCKKNSKFAPIDFFGVFDGHGWPEGSGHVVSAFIPPWIKALFMNKDRKYPISKPVLDHYYDEIEKKVEQNIPDCKECGSTALVVVRYYDNGEWLQVVNLGDCRAVVSRDGIAMNLTRDHKPCWPSEAKRLGFSKIYKDEGSIEYRVHGLSVSRGFGDVSGKPDVSHIPDNLLWKLDPSDRFVIIACDGLWESVSSEEAVNFVTYQIDGLDDKIFNVYDGKGTLIYPIKETKSIAKKLALYAIAKGSTDNVTIMVVIFK